MKIDLHIHTKTCSDGNLSIGDVFKEAERRNIDLMSITDHDSIDCQKKAIELAKKMDISYITGVELNVTFDLPPIFGTESNGKSISLDFLGYGYDIENRELKNKLKLIKEHRDKRALKILDKLNLEFEREGIKRFTKQDLKNIRDSVDGVFGRPHIANYLIEKGIVKDKQEAFDRYLVRCNVDKYPLTIKDASKLMRDAGGILVLAHPNDSYGTSLIKVSEDLDVQTGIVKEHMLEYIDGIECWHSRHDEKTVKHLIKFAKNNDLIMTGGSDCHQKPILLGTIDIPDYVSDQFNL